MMYEQGIVKIQNMSKQRHFTSTMTMDLKCCCSKGVLNDTVEVEGRIPIKGRNVNLNTSRNEV